MIFSYFAIGILVCMGVAHAFVSPSSTAVRFNPATIDYKLTTRGGSELYAKKKSKTKKKGSAAPASIKTDVDTKSTESFDEQEFYRQKQIAQEDIMNRMSRVRSSGDSSSVLKSYTAGTGFQSQAEVAKEEKMKKAIKAKAESAESLLDLLPPGIVLGIDRALISLAGLGLLVFVTCGIGISAEAFAVASKNPLPENVDSFIVNFLEPNFTPSLGAFFVLSSFYGLFKFTQINSMGAAFTDDSTTFRE